MNILVFYPYIPYPLDRGTYQRTFHLLRELAREHTVDLLALSEGGERMAHRAVFEKFCRHVRFVEFNHPRWAKLHERIFSLTPSSVSHWTLPHIGQALDEMLAANDYDLVHVCDIVMAQYFLRKHRDIPLSIDRSRVDLQFQTTQWRVMTRGWKKKLLELEGLAKMCLFEKRIARRANLEVVCGPDDDTFIRANISKKVPVKVVANGVDLEYFDANSVLEVRDRRPTIMFCGAMDYTPNVDALRWYFGEIHERLLAKVPALRVLIVGKSPAAEVRAYASREEVVVTGGVPDVRPYYRSAWLQIVPLRIGGGTRLKIVESMAIRTPVVSTTIGAQGLDLVHDENILLADDPESFANETARALNDAALRQRIELNGLHTVRERLSWPTLGAQLSSFYRQFFRSPQQQQPGPEHENRGRHLVTADLSARRPV